MDTTASSFTLRKNAKRAAEAMIRKGIAPAVDYGIKLSDDGRFEIVWKIATSAPNEWPYGTHVMVRKRKSWREATIISRLDPDHWRAEYPGGGSGMFREADIRAYDAERDATTAEQPRRAKATTPLKSARSRYGIDPEAIAAGRLPQRAPVVTSAANPHYQKHFDRLFA